MGRKEEEGGGGMTYRRVFYYKFPEKVFGTVRHQLPLRLVKVKYSGSTSSLDLHNTQHKMTARQGRDGRRRRRLWYRPDVSYLPSCKVAIGVKRVIATQHHKQDHAVAPRVELAVVAPRASVGHLGRGIRPRATHLGQLLTGRDQLRQAKVCDLQQRGGRGEGYRGGEGEGRGKQRKEGGGGQRS